LSSLNYYKLHSPIELAGNFNTRMKYIQLKSKRIMNSNGKVLLAILSGMAAGLLVGVLLAPEKGSETRRKLIDTASDLADRVKSAATDAIDKLRQLGDTAESSMEEAGGSVGQ
jgi:gas vesicle protein